MGTEENGGEDQVEEKTDREEGGPTADESAEGDATGGAKGTRESEMDSHE
jgi:hypothetical protein